jgi:hypothetical protein
MMTKLTFHKTRRNKFTNKPSMTAVARPVSAHSPILTDGRTDSLPISIE